MGDTRLFSGHQPETRVSKGLQPDFPVRKPVAQFLGWKGGAA
jgi:hypothetical protein